MNDSSVLSGFTSDPIRVCFCENGRPDCFKIVTNITVYPGEPFNLSLVVVGYGLGTVPGSVVARSKSRGDLFGSSLQVSQEIRGSACQRVGYSVVSEADQEQIALAVDTQSFGRSLEQVKAVLDFQLHQNTKNISAHPMTQFLRVSSIFLCLYRLIFCPVQLVSN